MRRKVAADLRTDFGAESAKDIVADEAATIVGGSE